MLVVRVFAGTFCSASAPRARSRHEGATTVRDGHSHSPADVDVQRYVLSCSPGRLPVHTLSQRRARVVLLRLVLLFFFFFFFFFFFSGRLPFAPQLGPLFLSLTAPFPPPISSWWRQCSLMVSLVRSSKQTFSRKWCLAATPTFAHLRCSPSSSSLHFKVSVMMACNVRVLCPLAVIGAPDQFRFRREAAMPGGSVGRT